MGALCIHIYLNTVANPLFLPLMKRVGMRCPMCVRERLKERYFLALLL